MIKKIIIQIFLIILSYIIPKKKNLILFGAGCKHDFRGNPKYLFLYSNLNTTKYKTYWSTTSKDLYKELKNKDLPVIFRNSLTGFCKIMRAKYLVIEKSANDVYYTDSIFGKFNFIQTWHGIVFKKTGMDALIDKKGYPGNTLLSNNKLRKFMIKNKLLSMMKYKLILSTSKNFENLLIKSFLNKNVKTFGYPRNDIFFNKTLIYKDYEKELSLDKFNKVILYAPTFRDNKNNVTPFSNTLILNLEKFLGQNNYLLLIKKHPLDNSIFLPENLKNIKDISFYVDDIQDLLYYSDVLISDYSSVVHDFILTNRPIIYYDYDFVEYKKSCRGFYYDYHKILSGPFASNEKELFNLIKNIKIWSQDKSYLEKYKNQKNLFHTYQNGNYCKRFFNYIDKMNEK